MERNQSFLRVGNWKYEHELTNLNKSWFLSHFAKSRYYSSLFPPQVHRRDTGGFRVYRRNIWCNWVSTFYLFIQKDEGAKEKAVYLKREQKAFKTLSRNIKRLKEKWQSLRDLWDNNKSFTYLSSKKKKRLDWTKRNVGWKFPKLFKIWKFTCLICCANMNWIVIPSPIYRTQRAGSKVVLQLPKWNKSGECFSMEHYTQPHNLPGITLDQGKFSRERISSTLSGTRNSVTFKWQTMSTGTKAMALWFTQERV